MRNRIYAIPGTDNWVEADMLSKELQDEGYIEMPGYPPEIPIEDNTENKKYVANEEGLWVLVDDTSHKHKMEELAKRLFGVNKVTSSMLNKLSKEFSELAKKQ